MNKKGRIALIAAVLKSKCIECDDGNDNDGDSTIDYNDDGCTGPTDNDESNCGDSVCEGLEDCDNCATDCLDIGQVCCDGIAYDGDCCNDNDCTSPAVCVNHYCEILDSCSDTDYGFAPDVQGTVDGYYNGDYYSDTDYCIDSSTLMEYYCIESYETSVEYNCSVNSTCTNGWCDW